MIVLLSPAKNLDLVTPLPPLAFTQPQMLDDARQLVSIMRDYSAPQLARLMTISPALAALNGERFANWQLPLTLANARPAALTFAGTVYQGLEASTFTRSDFEFAQQHLRILSGLYGLLRPLDLIAPYRLEMGTRVQNPRGANLYTFWGDRITAKINEQALETGAEAILNLASQEYFKSVNPARLVRPVIEPVFKDYKNGEYKIISVYAKHARGAMAAFAIHHRLTRAEDLQKYNGGGYRFDAEHSTGQRWIFTRRL